VDSHVHIESSMMSPAGFAAAVLPRGTTTVVVDPHEIGNVLGLRGVRYMLDATAGLPLRVFVQAPSCVPAVPDLETAGAAFGAAEVAEMLSWERVVGIAEVMDYVGVLEGEERMTGVLDAAHEADTVISGHCPGLRGRELAAYLVAGPRSDHEVENHQELLEKLRLGMTVEVRDSSFSENVRATAWAVEKLSGVPPNLVACTDDVYPTDLRRHGHLDHLIRSMVAAGIPPLDAVRTATLHGANRHRLHNLGTLAPGRWGDVLLVESLEEFFVDEVFVGGRLVARRGSLVDALPRASVPLEEENTVHLTPPPRPEDFVLRSSRDRQEERLRVMVLEPDGTRGLTTLTFPVREGRVDISAHPGVCLVAVLERHGKGGRRSLVPVRGLKLKQGAVATTVAHDSHNLLVVGRDPEEMVVAARELAQVAGGVCCAAGGEVVASLPLPIAGLMSPLPLEELAPRMDALNEVLHDLGMDYREPLSPILGLALPVIPHYGITDRGLVDVDRQVVVPVRAG
jgi:adenine deaminase